MSGEALELVPAGAGEGPKHTLSRIFDALATDRDIYTSELEPMLSHLIEGSNVSIIVAGNHRSGCAPFPLHDECRLWTCA